MINSTHADSWATPSTNGTLPDSAPSPQDVLAQLERVLASPDFIASERNRRFLRHVVERTLRGETARGYEIGTLVFGRPQTFNATADPIVRIEAGKLRRDLETYYLKSGQHDPVQIDLPKGAYRAQFSYRHVDAAGNGVQLGGRVILRAALLGMAGAGEEAGAAWREVIHNYPDFARNPRSAEALENIHGQDERIRRLLLEGLERASRSVERGAPVPMTAMAASA
jgi:hypothetical protein